MKKINSESKRNSKMSIHELYTSIGIFVFYVSLLILFLWLSSISVTAAERPLYQFGAAPRNVDIHFAPNVTNPSSSSRHIINPNLHFVTGGYTGGFAEGERVGVLRAIRHNRSVTIFEGETMRNMDLGAGRFTFSSLYDGNLVLIAHNRGRFGFFSFARHLQPGDMLEVETNRGTRSFVVDFSHIIHETDFTPLMEFGDHRLTLITCVEYRQRYRRVVVAFAVDN